MPFEPRLFEPDDADAALRAAAEGLHPEFASKVNAHKTGSSLADGFVTDGFLAPELEALAEQLSEDSGHLAQCYPAANPRMNKLVARAAQLAEAEAQRGDRRSASVTVWLARCGLAASLLLAIGVWWQSAPQEAAPVAPVSVALTSPERPAQPEAGLTPVAPVFEPESTLVVHEPVEPPTPMLDPQVFLELDAASQAAVADLVQEGELDQSSLSL